MSENKVEVKLEDGTLIRHKVAGYEGRIEGTTKIQSCFTLKGELLPHPNSKQLSNIGSWLKGNPFVV